MLPEKQADISLTKLQDEVERMCQEVEGEEGELNEEEGEVDTTTSANPASWELQQRVPVRASSRGAVRDAPLASSATRSHRGRRPRINERPPNFRLSVAGPSGSRGGVNQNRRGCRNNRGGGRGCRRSGETRGRQGGRWGTQTCPQWSEPIHVRTNRILSQISELIQELTGTRPTNSQMRNLLNDLNLNVF